MKNIEGIRNWEMQEQSIEKKSMTITEDNGLGSDTGDIDFSDCAKTPEDKKRELQELKEEILYFNSCTKQKNENEMKDDFEDCRKK